MTNPHIYMTACVELEGGKYTKGELSDIFRRMGKMTLNVRTELNPGYIKHWLCDEVLMTLCFYAVKFRDEKCPTPMQRKHPEIEAKKVMDQFDVCIREIQKLEKML